MAPDFLRQLLATAVQRSFNCITIDGDMSTNDTVIALANGAAGAVEIAGEGEGADAFYAALERVCRELARMIARDGEGATKLVDIRVFGARDETEARQVGLSVANSSLVKTAVFGREAWPNCTFVQFLMADDDIVQDIRRDIPGVPNVSLLPSLNHLFSDLLP